MAVAVSPATLAWLSKKAKIRSFVEAGQPVEGMKVVMQEMRAFSNTFEVHKLNIDTSIFYSDPATFGLEMKSLGVKEEALEIFSGILAERGGVFMALDQPMRAFPDLQAAFRMSPAQDEVTQALFERAKEEAEAMRLAEKRAEQQKKVPITILTGFLGAGKTTLLNYILRAKHGKRYAVIENEVGQVGIDNQLLDGESTKTEEKLTLLDNGCLCCTVRTDLIDAVTRILDKAESVAASSPHATAADNPPAPAPALDAILIETTGLADPGPICKTFYAEVQLRQRARVDGILTVVDAHHFVTQLERTRSKGAVNESAQQVAFADRILLNKTDTVEPVKLEDLEKQLRTMNAYCQIIRCSLAKSPEALPLDRLFGVDSFSLDRVLEELSQEQPEEATQARKRPRTDPGFCAGFAQKEPSRHDTGVGTCSFTWTGKPMVLDLFVEVMNTIRAERAMDLYRYKGTLCVLERSGVMKKAVLQGVHDMCEFEPRGVWPAGVEPKSQLVLIGRNLDQAFWGRLFEQTLDQALGKELKK